MTTSIKKYQKDFSYSYCIGVFPTIELLQERPKDVLEVVISSKGVANEGVEKITKTARSLGISVSENNKFVEEISGKQNAYAVAVFRKFESPIDAEKPHLVLTNPSDTGNLGTILRTALAFGVQDIVIIKPAVDHFDPKTVRASMGAIFQMRISSFDSFETYSKKFPRDFFMFTPDGKTDLNEVTFSKSTSLVFGTESAGIPEEVKSLGMTVRIQHSDKVDSLNLPISVGIVLHKFENG